MAAKAKKSRSTQPAVGSKRSSGVVYWIIAGLALLGLADATFLTVAHLTGDDAVCGSLVGCSTVLGSRYATMLGIPTATFGALAYFTAFSLATLAACGYGWSRKLLIAVVSVMFLASLYFLYLQAFVLHAFCPFCLFSAALTFFLAGLLLAIPSRV